ncbi:OmpH family outer membrane protein [Confluentibacter citreus]|uniref:OmpH family outer membrane protein n=1 Tax=Confluentibacter citreus TaxID=2007307 RepID=UPI000C292438|nr:OmpH family outer membrane protein [Confluentibacter citreus]
MKQLKTLLLATVLCIGTVSFTYAQSKIAHINTNDLISAMPEMKAATAELEALSKTYQTDLQSMGTELQNKAKQYDAEAATKTQEENNKRQEELLTMEQNARQFQSKAQQDLQAKQETLFKPITEKARAAILKVGRAQGFEYVLDSGVGVTIVADGKDLLNDVKKELGI